MNYNTENEQLYIGDLPQEIKTEKKNVSALFMSLAISMSVPYLFVIAISCLLSFFPGLYSSDSILPIVINELYIIFSIMLFCCLTRRMASACPCKKEDMTPKAFICFVIASVFMMMAGSYIGNIMSFLVEALTGIRQVNVVDSVVRSYPVWLIVIVVVVLAPVTEEFMFRKLLIDRLSRYGTVFSVLISGIVFGAFHGNFYQFFYGSMIGCLLAWVYCTYAKLRYCIFIHAILNFIGTVVPLFILGSNPQTEIIRSIVSYMYSLFVVASIPLGIIMIGLYAKKIRFLISDGVLIRPEKTLSKNAGFIVYIVFVLLLFALNILG